VNAPSWSDLIEAKVTPGHPFFALIDQAYRVFACPKPESIGVCERCCMDREIEADFFSSPIRQLPLRYVRDWYFAAYQPPGVPKETWAYLLPRILEILAFGEDVGSAGIEVSLSRYETGNPDNWSTREWAVIDQFQRAFLTHKIEHGDDRLDDVLCMFGLAGWSLGDLIDQVRLIDDATLAERFWNDWCHDHVPGREGIWVTAFWEGSANSTLFEFYASKELHVRMAKLALADGTEPSLSERAAAVASVIEKAS